MTSGFNMALELRQQLKLTQQLIMTPQLQMAIKLLQLSRLELMDTIHRELEENPALEEVTDGPGEGPLSEPFEAEETPLSEIPSSPEVAADSKGREEFDWSGFLDDFSTPSRAPVETEDREAPKYEAFITRKESLNDHLLWQFLMTKPSREDEGIASLIIGNLNKDGYLQVSVEEIAATGAVELERVVAVLSLLQTFDPVGVCARDLRECLLIQARYLGFDRSIITEIISEHLSNLEKKNYKAVCKALKISMDEVVSAVAIIKAMEPRPGRQFSDDNPQYIIPDIYVYKMENDFTIVLNDDGMPKLRVSSLFRRSVGRGRRVGGEAEDYIQDRVRSAAWLIKSIHQRQKTIYRVMESILRFQREFFENGIAHLRPMVLRDVAQDIGMHESTISRVTTNKYAYTPQGIFELKYFFNSSIKRDEGGAIASASVMEKIRQLIASEDHRRPHSDDKIAQMLKGENIQIARRTVAKYREIMRVLPSNKRKEI
jgi:RNA polymerase sigma-54 factor